MEKANRCYGVTVGNASKIAVKLPSRLDACARSLNCFFIDDDTLFLCILSVLKCNLPSKVVIVDADNPLLYIHVVLVVPWRRGAWT